MQKGEATKLGIDTRWQRFFRFGDGKSNLAPPMSDGALASGWMELVSVGLGNGVGDGLDRIVDGDSVGVVVARTSAEMEREGAGEGGSIDGSDISRDGATGVGASDASLARSAALEAVRAGGGLYRRDIRAGDAWVGVPIARALRLDISDKADRGRVNATIAAWLRSGLLIEVTRPDAKRMLRTYVDAAPNKHTDDSSGPDVFG